MRLCTSCRGTTLGILGHGSVGEECLRLARGYGMKVVAMRQRPERSPVEPAVQVQQGLSQGMSLTAWGRC